MFTTDPAKKLDVVLDALNIIVQRSHYSEHVDEIDDALMSMIIDELDNLRKKLQKAS